MATPVRKILEPERAKFWVAKAASRPSKPPVLKPMPISRKVPLRMLALWPGLFIRFLCRSATSSCSPDGDPRLAQAMFSAELQDPVKL
jgi:hypothetical protein